MEDEIRPISTKSLFELVRMGGFRGMGGAGFRVTQESGREGGGRGGALNVSPGSNVEFGALSWIRPGRGLCFALAWRGSVLFCATTGFISERLQFLSASAAVGDDTTTQSGSFLGLKGFDGRFGFGNASLNGGSKFDRAARPVSLLEINPLRVLKQRWNPYHHPTTTCCDQSSYPVARIL